jgi:hypothetical protein
MLIPTDRSCICIEGAETSWDAAFECAEAWGHGRFIKHKTWAAKGLQGARTRSIHKLEGVTLKCSSINRNTTPPGALESYPIFAPSARSKHESPMNAAQITHTAS